MPATTAVNQAALLNAIGWSLQYLLDPKRGNGKNLPPAKELEDQFPSSNITPELIEFELKNLFNVESVEKIQGLTQGQIQEVVEKIQAPEKAQAVKQTQVPYARPTAPPRTKRVGALGVLAELEVIEPLLRKHNQEAAAKISQSLKPQVQSLITQLGIKDLPKDQLENLSRQIAQEVTRETLENVPKIADLAQIPDVVTDSLVQTLLVDPTLAPRLEKFDEAKLVEKTTAAAGQITQAHNQDLEKSAVLGSFAEIAKLAKPNQEILETIADHVQQIVESHAPLTTPGNQQIIKASLETYLVSYLDEIKKQLPGISPTSLPSFENLQKIKEVAHNKATAKVGTVISATKGTEQVERQIGYKTLAGNLAVAQRLAPLKVLPQQTLHLATGSGLILSSDKNLSDAQLSLLAHDQEWFNKELKKTASQIANFQKRKNLSYQERKEKAQAQIKFTRLQKAQELKAKNPKSHQAFLNLFRNNLEVSQASYTARSFFEQRYGYFMPRTITNSQRFGPRLAFATIAPSSLSLFGRLNPGFSFSTSHLAPAFGMGMAVGSINPVRGAVLGIGRKIRNIAGAAFGGLALYFLGLGKAAFTGFLIGAGIGGTAGAIAGAVIPVALLGPAGILLWPVTIPLGFFLGGSIGGVAGGLIGLGLASGSATAISTGVGAGIGGTVGAVTGGVIGFTVVGAIPVIGPFLAPLGAILGATIGAYVGAFIGGALGYLFGHYILGSTIGTVGFGAAVGFYLGGPVGAAIGAGIGWLATGGWIQIKNFFAGTPSAVAGAGTGFFGAAAGFFTGLASTIWGGLSAAGGAIVGFFGGAANFIVGGLGSLAVPASAAAIPVAGSIGAVAVGGTIVGIVTAATFFNPEAELGTEAVPPAENLYLSIQKVASPTHLDKPGPDITFTITLTAKTDLESVNVTDQLKVTTKNNNTFNVQTDKNGNPISPIPCPSTMASGETCSYTFSIGTNDRFDDSTVSNTAVVTALPKGQSTNSQETVTVVVTVGNPPGSCPRGWPAIGEVTQGPEGSFSHSSSIYGEGEYEALDIAQGVGRPVYATVEGAVTVLRQDRRSNLDQRVKIVPTNCPGLKGVHYWHLSAVLVADGGVVRHGQEIGRTGAFTGSDGIPAPHIHYQFNEPAVRSFKIEQPYIPQNVLRRDCNEPLIECGITITSAP